MCGQDWLTNINVKFYESKINLNWKPILKNIMEVGPLLFENSLKALASHVFSPALQPFAICPCILLVLGRAGSEAPQRLLAEQLSLPEALQRQRSVPRFHAVPCLQPQHVSHGPGRGSSSTRVRDII